MANHAKTEILVNYINNLPGFTIVQEEAAYDHMGAVIADAGLQAGVRYQTVVWPRVNQILTAHPEARTTSAFRRFLAEIGPETLLNWRGKKVVLITRLTDFFEAEGVETTTDLYQWLKQSENCQRLQQIKGVGDKTIDYFKLLVGLPTVAVDRHLFNFLARAGIPAAGYGEAQQLIQAAADRMGVSYPSLDSSIWQYMANRSQTIGAGNNSQVT
jgi:hypothetical protein